MLKEIKDLKDYSGKEFNCGCRNWVISWMDKQTVEEFNDPEYNLIHECGSLKVWQEKKGLKRVFKIGMQT